MNLKPKPNSEIFRYAKFSFENPLFCLCLPIIHTHGNTFSDSPNTSTPSSPISLFQIHTHKEKDGDSCRLKEKGKRRHHSHSRKTTPQEAACRVGWTFQFTKHYCPRNSKSTQRETTMSEESQYEETISHKQHPFFPPDRWILWFRDLWVSSRNGGNFGSLIFNFVQIDTVVVSLRLLDVLILRFSGFSDAEKEKTNDWLRGESSETSYDNYEDNIGGLVGRGSWGVQASLRYPSSICFVHR